MIASRRQRSLTLRKLAVRGIHPASCWPLSPSSEWMGHIAVAGAVGKSSDREGSHVGFEK